MKLIFLDVDGVLNYAGWAERWGLFPRLDATVEDLMAWIDPEKVALVNEIVRRTGAKVILSSSTRTDVRMGIVLQKRGLSAPLLDAIPILQWTLEADGSIGMKTRADEVYESWVKHKPSTFVVLDDQDFGWDRLAERLLGPVPRPGEWVPEFFVKTYFKTGGLQREHVERAVEILNR